jgi:diguanylate cyclase (GGDEF)-like protein
VNKVTKKNKDKKLAAELVIADKELSIKHNEKAKHAAELNITKKELVFQKDEKEQLATELDIANKELRLEHVEKEQLATELDIANKELSFEQSEKKLLAAQLEIANEELSRLYDKKTKLSIQLDTINKELSRQFEEKTKLSAELDISNKELSLLNDEKVKSVAELVLANKELSIQNNEKIKRADELVIANKKMILQNDVKVKRAAELVIVNKKLSLLDAHDAKRATELVIANKELIAAQDRKAKRAANLVTAYKKLSVEHDKKVEYMAELDTANKELSVAQHEKAKRAAELIIANKELSVAQDEKATRAAELVIANKELNVAQHEKAKRAAELVIANKELSFQNDIKARRAAELVIANKELSIQNDENMHLAMNLANYDVLTQLPNRYLLFDRINHALAASARSGKRGALLFLDLDHFKNLNDTLGHDVGDLLLQQVAQRLITCIREEDTIARIGGDEFVIVLEDLSESAIEAASKTNDVAEKVFLTLNKPYQLNTHYYQNTISIGATLFIGHELKPKELLKQADIAMYQSKSKGRNTLSFFNTIMQEIITARVNIENGLHRAIEQQQFQLHYQIQVDSMGHPFGAEALIRWQHPKRGIVSPLHFIPVAEETGLIIDIGQWVLETACAQLKQWEQDELTRHLTLSVNVSAKQFFQKEFLSQVQATVQRYSINPSMLKLELTESMLVDDIENIMITINTLNEIGIKISLDDFGTGYSSLQYLKKLLIYQLKIDQSFVRDIVTDIQDEVIIRTIIAMAHSLDIGVIAEGVETEEHRQLLLANGCNHFQGYLFSKPVPIDEFEILLRKS